jgi:outer membrane protein OmpA-like peptidoglycan-associated protein/ABC-type nitrate/sulfonate/bicarbonate transport system substrate-binding protein
LKKGTAFFVIAVLMIAAAIFVSARAIKYVEEKNKAEVLAASSDAANLTEQVRMAGDAWAGYAVFRSPQFQRFLEAESIGLTYTDDGADLTSRMAKLASGEYDVVVATVDSYLVNGRGADYPGVIMFVVDESRGGDGIVATQSVKTLNGLAAPGVKIALTPNSPSDFLLKSVAAHFDLAPLKVAGDWRVETKGSDGALAALRGGSVQAAVLWEPELSQATAGGQFHKLFTTEKTEGLIVDVCIARRDFVVNKPKVAEAFVRSYFQSLRFYMSDDEAFVAQMAKDGNVSPDIAKVLLDGIQFATLTKNTQHYFGITGGPLAREELLTSIRAATDVLIETKLLPSDPLHGDGRRIINKSFVELAYSNPNSSQATASVFKGTPAKPEPTPELAVEFPTLGNDAWDKLGVIGTLRVRPVYFQSATATLTDEGKNEIRMMGADLAVYPKYRLLVRGHTSTDGDETANRVLSQQRADAVAAYLAEALRISPSRIRAVGVGGSMPLDRVDGESDRRWKGRLPRVELLLVEDPAIG